MGMSRVAVLSDAQWERIVPLLPSSGGRRGRPFRNTRRVVEGIIYRYRCGIAWRDLPADSGPWQTVWKRHRRYAADGTWDEVLAELLGQADAAAVAVAARSATTTRPTATATSSSVPSTT